METMYHRTLPIIILALLFNILISFPSYAQEQTEMTISLKPDGAAHITILSENVQNPENLKTVIGEPRVKGIYQGRFSEIFGPVENLTLALKGSELRIEFEAPSIAAEKGGNWLIERREFGSKMAPVAVLKVELPGGAERISTEPEPSEVSSGYMVWRNVAFVPAVSYGSGRPPYLPLLAAILAIAAILLLSKRKFFR